MRSPNENYDADYTTGGESGEELEDEDWDRYDEQCVYIKLVNTALRNVSNPKIKKKTIHPFLV